MTSPAKTSPANVLIDLDGTISDPNNGIVSAFRYALDQVGQPASPGEDLRFIIGPPLRELFLQRLGSAALMRDAIRHYRNQYGTRGLYESVPYAGMIDSLRVLQAAGLRLFIATSKLQNFAEKILGHFGIIDLFDGVYGSRPDGSFDNKTDLIGLLLTWEKLDPSHCVMVGDRKHDVIGALANRVPCIGAAWGFGGAAELTEAGATLVCDAPAELPGCIRRVPAQNDRLAATP